MRKAWKELNKSFTELIDGHGIVFVIISVIFLIFIFAWIMAFYMALLYGVPTVLLKWAIDILSPVFNGGIRTVTYGQSFALVVIIKLLVAIGKQSKN